MFDLKKLTEMPLLLTQRSLAESRAPISKEKFVDALASTDLGRIAAGMLWEKLAEIIVFNQFTPYPNDDLRRTFGLAEEDLDEDVILDIIKATGSVVPSSRILVKFGPVNTPSDIIMLIENGNSSFYEDD